MKWYNKYLTVFEQTFQTVPKCIITEVRENLYSLQHENPVASVVIIAHNEETRLLSCLWSLSNNKCRYPIEIIGVDNNSSDRTADVFESVGLRYYTEERKSPGYARTRGLIEAKGKYCICIDSDTIYPPKYIESTIDALKKPDVVAVYSSWNFIPNKEFPRFFMLLYVLIRDIHLFLLSFKSPERCVRGLVFAHDTELGKKIGYRVNIKRGEDGYMAYKLKEYGKIVFIRKWRRRPLTSTATLETDGSLIKAFWIRGISAIRGFRKYIRKTKGEVKDQPNNIIKDL